MKKAVWCFLSVILVFSCRNAGDERRMAQIIAEADSMNRNNIAMSSDSLLLEACRYYDHYGTPNQRMQAHYLLGCVYRDRGEAPEALEAYHTAADCADTTASDCDYRRLSRVHGQMAYLFNREYLPFEMKEEIKLLQKYALKAKDTLSWLIGYEHLGHFYNMVGNQDSTIIMLEDAFSLYQRHGYHSHAANCAEGLPLYLIERGEVKKAMHYLRIFETLSDNYNNKTQTASHPLYYYTKGRCYLASAQPDSAIFFFQKLLSVTRNPHDIESAYKGLHHAYLSKGISDSIAKYASLCYQITDTNFQEASTEKLRQMQGLYNYSRHQVLSRQKEKEAAQARQNTLIILVSNIIVVILLICWIAFIQLRRRHEIASLTKEYEHKILQIQRTQDDINDTTHEEYRKHLINHLDSDTKELRKLLGIPEKKEGEESVNLCNTEIYKTFMAAATHPQIKIKEKDWKELHELFDKEIPNFRKIIAQKKFIPEKDLRLCMLLRMQFGVSEICVIMGLYSQYVSIRRSQLLMKHFKIKGKPEDFDRILMLIG